jgi:hypothetical protein
MSAEGVATGEYWQDLEKPEMVFYKYLVAHGFDDTCIQILQSEKITSLSEIRVLSNEDLKGIGLKLGEIAKLKSLQ